MAGGIRQFAVVTAVIWVLGGLGVWLTGGSSAREPPTVAMPSFFP